MSSGGISSRLSGSVRSGSDDGSKISLRIPWRSDFLVGPWDGLRIRGRPETEQDRGRRCRRDDQPALVEMTAERGRFLRVFQRPPTLKCNRTTHYSSLPENFRSGGRSGAFARRSENHRGLHIMTACHAAVPHRHSVTEHARSIIQIEHFPRLQRTSREKVFCIAKLFYALQIDDTMARSSDDAR